MKGARARLLWSDSPEGAPHEVGEYYDHRQEPEFSLRRHGHNNPPEFGYKIHIEGIRTDLSWTRGRGPGGLRSIPVKRSGRDPTSIAKTSLFSRPHYKEQKGTMVEK